MHIELNIEYGKFFIEYFQIYLYTNDHVVIPRYVHGVYGSYFHKILVERNRSYHKQYYVIKNKLLAIDTKGKKCKNDGTNIPVGRCIIKYFEDQYNCTAPFLMGDKTKDFCSKEQLGKINDQNNISIKPMKDNLGVLRGNFTPGLGCEAFILSYLSVIFR